MRIVVLVVLVVLVLAPPAVALDPIIPRSVSAAGGFGVGLPVPLPNADGYCTLVPATTPEYPGSAIPQNGSWIRCFVSVPPGALAIVGWSGFWWIQLGTDAPDGTQSQYSTIKVWHNGGTPHKLQDTVFVEEQIAGLIPPKTYPAGTGHLMTGGGADFAFIDLICAAWKCNGGITIEFLMAP